MSSMPKVVKVDEDGADEIVSTSAPSSIPEIESEAEKQADATMLPPSEVTKEETQAFSVFTTNQKRVIVLTTSLAGFFSPLSGSIYYPALNTIAEDLGVSSSKANLTVTTYMIIQGLAPMITAGFSDGAGRRPAYIFCFVVYIAANLGLALQNDYAALMVLRCLQSGGSSGTIALANGVVGDLITSAERGSYIAFASISSILGPTLSPIIGGLISQYWNWHGIFWFLLAFGGCFFVPLLLFLPETCRKVVGDGSVPPPTLNMNIIDKIRHANRAKSGIPLDKEKLEEYRKNYKLTFPNPLKTLVVLADVESAIVLLGAGLALADFYAISTGASTAFRKVYGFNDLEVSLMFLPIGAGGILSAFTTGKMVDWNYRRHAHVHNLIIDKKRQQDLTNFPIEKARLEIALPLFYLGAASVMGYGWVMDEKVSLAGPAILLFLMGYSITAAFQILNVLMVDIYPGRPATATAASNIVRCELGAAASAAIVPMARAMGNGWSYTLLALLFVAYSPALLWIMKSGMKWRQAKKAKEDREMGGSAEVQEEDDERAAASSVDVNSRKGI